MLKESGNEKFYLAEKETAEGTKFSMIRAIFIPCEDDKLDPKKNEFETDEDKKKYVSRQIKKYKKELNSLRSLSGKGFWLGLSESYDVTDVNDTQCLIVARFGDVRPLECYISESGLSQGALVRLGINVCKSFEHIRKQERFNGNLRPEDIFVDNKTRFKVGKIDPVYTDTDKIRSIDNLYESEYAAPECFNEENAAFSYDTYALGIIMYTLLNGGKLPFEKDGVSREEAVRIRAGGETIPEPEYSEPRLTKIVMKACNAESEKRYKSPAQMRKDLEKLYDELFSEVKNQKDTKKDKKEPPKAEPVSGSKENENTAEEKKSYKGLRTLLTVVLVCALLFAGVKGYKYYRSLSIQNHKINLEENFDYVYNNTEKRPNVIINGLTEGEDYTVIYSDNIEVGTAKITVKAKGKYKGEKTKEFEIVPGSCGELIATDITSTSLTLSWDEVENCDRYFIYRSIQSNFYKIATVYSDTFYEVTGLEGGKLYKYKVCAVKQVGETEYKGEKSSIEVTTAER